MLESIWEMPCSISRYTRSNFSARSISPRPWCLSWSLPQSCRKISYSSRQIMSAVRFIILAVVLVSVMEHLVIPFYWFLKDLNVFFCQESVAEANPYECHFQDVTSYSNSVQDASNLCNWDMYSTDTLLSILFASHSLLFYPLESILYFPLAICPILHSLYDYIYLVIIHRLLPVHLVLLVCNPFAPIPWLCPIISKRHSVLLLWASY